jgi:hypothetical protein
MLKWEAEHANVWLISQFWLMGIVTLFDRKYKLISQCGSLSFQHCLIDQLTMSACHSAKQWVLSANILRSTVIIQIRSRFGQHTEVVDDHDMDWLTESDGSMGDCMWRLLVEHWTTKFNPGQSSLLLAVEESYIHLLDVQLIGQTCLSRRSAEMRKLSIATEQLTQIFM